MLRIVSRGENIGSNSPRAPRASLGELLKPRGWLEWDEFEIEFHGSLEWIGWSCGHLGVFGGIARIDKVVSAVFSAPPRCSV